MSNDIEHKAFWSKNQVCVGGVALGGIVRIYIGGVEIETKDLKKPRVTMVKDGVKTISGTIELDTDRYFTDAYNYLMPNKPIDIIKL